jgi:hypothetical protein
LLEKMKVAVVFKVVAGGPESMNVSGTVPSTIVHS